MNKRVRALARSVGRKCLQYGFNADNTDMEKNGEIWLMRQLAPMTGTIIDVGANRGLWSAHALRTNPEARIVAVEPVPEFAEMARERLCDKAEVINKALSDSEGQLTVYKARGGARAAPMRTKKKLVPISVPCVTGDTLVSEMNLDDITFIKIDTDGSDLSVIGGFAKTIRTQRPAIQFEYSRFWIGTRHFLGEALELFEQAEYDVGRLMPTAIETFSYSPAQETFMNNNFIAMPKESGKDWQALKC